MREKDMEDLIASHPGDFFPEHALVLKGRQQVFAGIGRFDLLFSDRFGTNVLMELKAVTAKYENATQLAKYKEALEAQGDRNILMWLVAPLIPRSVRDFLDQIGIEYSEIHEGQFKRVAERHGKAFAPEAQQAPAAVAVRRAVPREPAPFPEAGADVAYRLVPEWDRGRLEQLLGQFDAAVRRGIDKSVSAKLRSELLESPSPSMSRSTMRQLAKWCKSESPLYWDGMAVARQISELLFGVVLDRKRFGL